MRGWLRAHLGIALLFTVILGVLLGCGGVGTGGIGGLPSSSGGYKLKGYIYKLSSPRLTASPVEYLFSPNPVNLSEHPELSPASGVWITLPDGSSTLTGTNGYFELDDVNVDDLWDLLATITDGSYTDYVMLPPIDTPLPGSGDVSKIYVFPDYEVAVAGDEWDDLLSFQVEAVDSSGMPTLLSGDDLEVTVDNSSVQVESWGYGMFLVTVPDSIPAGTKITLTFRLKSNPSITDTAVIEVITPGSTGGGSGGGTGTGYDVTGTIYDPANSTGDYSWYTIEIRGQNTYEYREIMPDSDGTFYIYDLPEDDYEVVIYDDQGNYFSSTSGEVEITGDSLEGNDYLDVDSDLSGVTLRIVRD